MNCRRDRNQHSTLEVQILYVRWLQRVRDIIAHAKFVFIINFIICILVIDPDSSNLIIIIIIIRNKIYNTVLIIMMSTRSLVIIYDTHNIIVIIIMIMVLDRVFVCILYMIDPSFSR